MKKWANHEKGGGGGGVMGGKVGSTLKGDDCW